MNLGYEKTTEFRTSDLPFAISNIELIFGAITSPAYWFIRDVEIWTRSVDVGDTPPTKQTAGLAAHLLQYVKTPDGETYKLGTAESIKVFIAETSEDFLISVLAGWLTLNAARRLEAKKKSIPPLTLSNVNNKQKTKVI